MTTSGGKVRAGAVITVRVAALAALTACGTTGDNGAAPGGSPAPTASATSTDPDASPSPTATPTAAPVALPTDCKAILSTEVLAELKGVPLNDPAFGPSGAQSDGSLVCIWGDPGADTTGLTTAIGTMRRGPALEMLNALVTDEGFTCYTPGGGTRCERTWKNATYPVTDGRTLFWRDDVLVDTRYSNLAPAGYTSAIIASLWD
ncbi:DUF3558 domain-containing protein [Microbacterium sp. H1-D42]|uniref:DUF3558 domain-containing protein n=1 Tax=Microbacterium sp. H1-D42 TaxID=2925844 RepID=UPI001F52F09C|nr:DUF3558 domain-containing protein [Microbacterium sp. H1-D42]UNK70177.1 DUF3558 domain-containing protein [Microbacterium sp. H1-D42]